MALDDMGRCAIIIETFTDRVRVRLFKPSDYPFDYHISYRSSTNGLLSLLSTGQQEGRVRELGNKYIEIRN